MSWIINGALTWQFKEMQKRRQRWASGIGGLSLKHHTTPLGPVLFSRRNNRIWYFIYHEQWSCMSTRQREEPCRGSCTTLCHYDCRPEENERPSNAAARKAFLSDCSAQMGAILSEMRWTKAGAKWMKRKAISRWICLIPLLPQKGTVFISHNCNTYGGEGVHQNQEYGKLSLWKLQKAAGKWDYSHNITLADKRKSHSEETGNETRKQVPELFLRV